VFIVPHLEPSEDSNRNTNRVVASCSLSDSGTLDKWNRIGEPMLSQEGIKEIFFPYKNFEQLKILGKRFPLDAKQRVSR
jgi:hypothetical protein